MITTNECRRAAWSLALLLVVVACGSPEGVSVPTEPVATVGTVSPNAAPTGAPSPVSTVIEPTVAPDYKWPDYVTEAAAYWASMSVVQFELHRFSTIEDLADSATVVVVGVPIGPGPTALIGGDPDNNEVTRNVSLIVEVREVVRSRGPLLGIATPRVGEYITVVVNRDPDGFSADPVLLFLQAPDDNRYYYQAPPEMIAPEYRDYYIETLEAFEAWRVGKYMFLNQQSVLAGDVRTTVTPLMPRSPLTAIIADRPIADIVEQIRSMPPPRD